MHVPAAHTDGDTMVFFRRSDVICTGASSTTTGYPRFDPERGGSIAGVIDALNRVLEIADCRARTRRAAPSIVPGHGRLSDETDVANYRDMVTIVRDRVAALIADGLTLEQVQRAKPTLDYDGIYRTQTGGWSGEQFVEAVYRDLKRRSAMSAERGAACVARGSLRCSSRACRRR